VVVLLKGGEG